MAVEEKAGKKGGDNQGSTVLTGLQKAELKIYREQEETIKCMFNPSQYRMAEGTKYAKKQEVGASSTTPQYVGGGESSLSLTLYFDTTENLGQLDDTVKGKSVLSYVKKISDLLKEDGDLHKPPEVEFIWGDLNYRGVLSSLSTEFTYFDLEGKPLRAKLDLTITAVPGTEAFRISPRNSPDRTKYRTVQEGMTLWKLAWEEYGDCERWKDIASYNQLMNPLEIYPGQVLKLPALKK